MTAVVPGGAGGPAACDGDRTRLLMFVSGFAMGGTERHVVNLGRSLDQSKFDIHLACFRRWGHFLEEIEERRLPIREYGIDSLHNRRTLREQLRFARDLRRHRIQIVHTYNFYPNVFALPAARLARVPRVVASIRDTGVYQTPMQKRVQRLVCRLAHCIVVNAEAVRRWLIEEGYEPKKIVVIRNGVDLSRFQRKGDGLRLRHELGVPPGAPIVAVVSRLHELKGLDDFLEAAAALAARHRDVRFLIVGDRLAVKDGTIVKDDAYKSGLENLAQRLGIADRVVFTGFRLDVPELLQEVAVSVLPSLSEGLPNSLLESMAAGVPVVATRVGGSPEAVEDGETGILVPPRDAAALARAIDSLLADPDRTGRMGQAGKRRMAEHFSLEGMARTTERLYRSLLSRRRFEAEGDPDRALRHEAV
jgi:glycosyltransferase involved in cell wall biosynthesis